MFFNINLYLPRFFKSFMRERFIFCCGQDAYFFQHENKYITNNKIIFQKITAFKKEQVYWFPALLWSRYGQIDKRYIFWSPFFNSF